MKTHYSYKHGFVRPPVTNFLAVAALGFLALYVIISNLAF